MADRNTGLPSPSLMRVRSMAQQSVFETTTFPPSISPASEPVLQFDKRKNAPQHTIRKSTRFPTGGVHLPLETPTRSPELAQKVPCELKRPTIPDSQQPGMGPASNASAGPQRQCVKWCVGCPSGPSDCSWITLYSSGTGRARWARPAVCGMQVH